MFVFDRVKQSVDLVSRGFDGLSSNFGAFLSGNVPAPVISQDGRYVAYLSYATNLVAGDGNDHADVFVLDREKGVTTRVNVGDSGMEADGESFGVSISANGRFLTFSSAATNLVSDDNNSRVDIFVVDLISKAIERVNVSDDGLEANGFSYQSSLSSDGRFVSFHSHATNLSPLAINTQSNVYVYDRISKKMELISKGTNSLGGNDFSGYASISGDGRFVAFHSRANDLIEGQPDRQFGVYVYDRDTEKLRRLGNGFFPRLSQDGRVFSFVSDESNYVENDTNNVSDVFVAPNPLIEPGLTRTIRPGDQIQDLNFGLIPDSGVISGRVFEDSLITNGFFDAGEPVLANATVFIDLNNNGVLNDREFSVVTDNNGNYRFTNVNSFRNYSIAILAPVGYEQIILDANLDASEKFARNVFLPAGGIVVDRDFPLRRIEATGQSSASVISGRLYDDRNANGIYDAGIDMPLANREVYLDVANFGVRDTNEPRELTDSEGQYLFTGLSSRIAAVTTTLDQTLVHASPLGSDFQLQRFPLFQTIQAFGNPQAIGSSDFNQDGFLDVAIALGEGNKLSIRLNDKSGGFLPDQINIELGQSGSGPTSLVVGHFDNNPRLDVALTANFAGNVTVLLNFDKDSQTFASTAYVKVGTEPLDIAAGQFTDDAMLDLVVVNKVGNTVQLLTNNGSGVFTAGAPIASGGKNSVSIAVGNFTGDASTDVAVVHASPSMTDTPFGGVTVLRGDGAGGLTLTPNYIRVGALPIDSVVADFNGDDRDDLAVANFSSNSISILLGQADGTFRAQAAILGTASGAFDIAVGDVDNDSDMDVIASNLRDRNISIFRNNGPDPVTRDVRFQPLENIGLGQFSLAQRMPLVVANFDKDKSGPGGTGTVDIVTIPQQTDTLHVLKNRLVNGTHRVALTGLNKATDLDFIIKSATLPPSLDVIANPLAILEDAGQQVVAFSGIAKGRQTGPALRITASSDNHDLIASPTVNYTEPNTTASVVYAPVANANGTAVITVTVRDAGADGEMNTADDGVRLRSFTVTVAPVNDPPTFVVKDGSRLTVPKDFGRWEIPGFVTDMRIGLGDVDQALTGFTITTDNANLFSTPPTIDASGKLVFATVDGVQGSALLTIALMDNGGRANGGIDVAIQSVVLDVVPGKFVRAEFINGRFVPFFAAGGHEFSFVGEMEWSNPFMTMDVNGNGTIEPLDALSIINALNAAMVFDAQGRFISSSELNAGLFGFLDTNADGLLTPLDALIVINALNQSANGEPPASRSAAPSMYPMPVSPMFSSFGIDRDDSKEELIDLAIEQLMLNQP